MPDEALPYDKGHDLFEESYLGDPTVRPPAQKRLLRLQRSAGYITINGEPPARQGDQMSFLSTIESTCARSRKFLAFDRSIQSVRHI